LLREIASGLDLPLGVIWNMADLGKPAILAELNQANRTFKAFAEDILTPKWTNRIIGEWLMMEIANKRLPFTPYWNRYCVPFSPAISIDMGRDSKAGIEENRSGLATATSWLQEDGEDFEETTDRLTYEARYRECSRLGVPYDPKLPVPLEQIRMTTANPPANPQTNEDSADTTNGIKEEKANAK
jgi:capsid protein